MSRIIDRQKAIKLRNQGKTYGQIIKELRVAKSTLSEWLSKYPLTEKQLILLELNKKGSRQLAAEKNRITKRQKRDKRLNEAYKKEKKRWKSLTKRELELAGIFLYWGEGRKSLKSALAINNTDPQVVKFALHWMTKALKVPKSKIKVELQLYSDMDPLKEITFWSDQLTLPKSQFYSPYRKESTRITIDHKGFGHGTCGIVVNDVRLKEKVVMGIKALADAYSKGET